MINELNLTYWFKNINDIFMDYSQKSRFLDDLEKRHIFINNGANILLVAHLDTVLKPELIGAENGEIYATGLDDRLGCAIADYLVTVKGVHADILLCDNEETGRSTAQYFTCPDRYNWICELDRAGTDFVDYGIGNELLNNKIESLGLKYNYGAFSDICSLRNIDCACFNLGIGYYRAHSQDSYAKIPEIQLQIDRFMQIYDSLSDTKFDREETPEYFDFYNYDDVLTCEFCGNDCAEFVHGYNICSNCFNMLLDNAPSYFYERFEGEVL